MEKERHIDVHYYELSSKENKQTNRLQTHTEFCSPFQRMPGAPETQSRLSVSLG